jgi:transposase-like protein
MVWYTARDLSQERVDTMVHKIDICRHCGSSDLMKYGIAPNGKQKYRCRTCGRQSREYPGSTAYSTERKEEILRAYQERSSLRGLERTFGVARSTVISWLKKSPAAPSTNTDTHSSSSARSNHDHARTG